MYYITAIRQLVLSSASQISPTVSFLNLWGRLLSNKVHRVSDMGSKYHFIVVLVMAVAMFQGKLCITIGFHVLIDGSA